MADLMTQFPNKGAEQVTLANWRTSPFNQWAFHHVREIVPTASIPNDTKKIQEPKSNLLNLSKFKILRKDKTELTYEEFLNKTKTDALVILRDGKLLEERYYNGMKRETPHILMSVSKSILGLLVGILTEQNVFTPDDLVSTILPEIKSTAYNGASIRHLLDMRTGVAFDEDYMATSGLMIDYRKATSWNPTEPNESPTDLRSFYNLLRNKTDEHGKQFHYVSPNTDLLGWVIERATGTRYNELLSELLWKPLGAQQPSYITVDRLGAPRVAGGLCTTTLDLALVGQLLLDRGQGKNQQILPESWLYDMQINGSQDAWNQGNFLNYFPDTDMHYRSKWYVEHLDKEGQLAMLFGVGVHGQNLFIDQEKKLVIAKFSSQDLPLDNDLIELTSQWVRSLKDFL